MGNLHDYEIRDEIGSGAYGAVYRAWQPAVGREVAIKVIRPEHAAEPEFVERFEAEAQMVARLEHPYIVPVHDYWRDESGAYLVMRLLGGGSLQDRLRDGALSLEEVLDLADDICDALAAAHDQGVVHRDLKPANILFDKRGNAYLSDFGIAKNLAAEVKLTQTGAILGTPDYISPEQIRGEELTPAADQYSLGIVLYEALTGRVPFPGVSVVALFQKHLTEPLPLLASIDPALPASLDPVLQRATAIQPLDRYANILELREALRLAVGHQLPAVTRQEKAATDQLSVHSGLPAFLEESNGSQRERPVFVGRADELDWLGHKLAAAIQGQGQIAFVVGDAGSGKSALLGAFAEQIHQENPDLLVAWGSCNAFTGSGDPYLPFRDIFSTLAGDIESRWSAGTLTQGQARALWEAIPDSTESLLNHGPDLIDTLVPGPDLVTYTSKALPAESPILPRLRQRTATASTTSGDLEQPQLFEQVIAVLREISIRRPLLLLLDDLQWADSGSINLLFHLGRRLAGTRILLVGAYRQDELTAGIADRRHPLLPLLDEFKGAYGDIFLDLSRKQERSFVDELVDSEPNRLDDSFRQTLYRHTDGHPLFTVELLRDMRERGALLRDADGRWVEGSELDWSALPPRVEGVIEARIGRLEVELRDILTIAAVEGEDFTARVLARIQEVQERRLLRALSGELERRHQLIREKAALRVEQHVLARYRFAHSLFQQYLYNNISPVERQLLHGEIADILQELYAGRTEEIAVQLARHYSEAGEGDKALPYLLTAGDNARTLYAFEEAIQHYERALAIYRDQGDYGRASRILMKLGLTYHSAFDYERSSMAYEESFRLQQHSVPGPFPTPLPPAPHALRLVLEDALTLDPGNHNDGNTSIIIGQLFSGLTDLTPDMNVVPDVAKSWEVLEGGRIYVFHLRDDVRWSDGVPVTAHDFVLGWRRALDHQSDSPAASMLYDVRAARAIHQGEDVDSDALGVEAKDDLTLRIELEQPSSYFLYLLDRDVAMPVPGHVIASRGDAWTDLDNFVSNGPFRLESYEKGRAMILRRNPTYHGDFRGNLEAVQLQFSTLAPESVANLLAGYKKDHYDMVRASWLRPAERRRTIQRYASDYMTGASLSTHYVNFNVRCPPFDDPRVRQAFVLATDRQVFAAVSEMGFASPASGGFVPLGAPGHVPGIALPYDPEEARRLLAEAGYPGGAGFPKLKALLFTKAARFVQSLLNPWQSNLGIEISHDIVNWATFTERIRSTTEPPHIYTIAWSADYPDPDNYLRVAIGNATEWRDETYDALVDRARRIMDHSERMRLYRQAEEILVQEAPLFPLFYPRRHFLVKPWVRDYRPEVIGAPAWKDVIIDPH